MDEMENGAAEQALPEVTPEEQARPEDFCSKKVYDELYDRYLRLTAEFDNFRKRTEREKQDLRATAAEKLVSDLLPVLDHLELALRHAREAGMADALTEGVGLVFKQFGAVLERHGLQPVEALGKPFDPRFHEAIVQVESADHEEHTVVEEFQRGYFLGGRTLRPSRVSVSRRPSPPAEEPGV